MGLFDFPFDISDEADVKVEAELRKAFGVQVDNVETNTAEENPIDKNEEIALTGIVNSSDAELERLKKQLKDALLKGRQKNKGEC